MNRLKTSVAVAAIAGLAAIPFVVIGQAPPVPDRPGPIPEGLWIPLTPDLGFVQTGQQVTAYGFNPELATSVSGFFMVRRDGRWSRIEIATSAQLRPAL
jgi:hypothetical protein